LLSAMKRYIGSLLVFICTLSIQAKSVQGLCVDGDRMYYFMEKVLYCQDVQSNAVLKTYEPNLDTALTGSLGRKVISTLNITADTAIATAKERIRNFYVLNLTVFEHRIFIGVRFKTLSKTYTNLYYALLELDKDLSFRNCFFLQGEQHFALLPFYPVEFRNDHTVLFPAMGNGKEDAGLGFYEFSLNSSKQSLIKSLKITESFKFLGPTGHMNNILLYPVLYTISGSDGHYFFEHPFPIVYDAKGKKVIDVYNAQLKKDSIHRDLDKRAAFNDYTYSLQFSGSQKAFANIVLATTQLGNTIYMAVSNADENKMDLVAYDIITAKHTIKTLDIPVKDTYMLFSGDKLYALHCTEEKAVISSIKL
jgi:hypothetical protein